MNPDQEQRLHQVMGMLAVVSVLVALVAVSSVRLSPIDLPWHLATGQRIVEQGVFPRTNTFSWVYPDYPLYQQYPLFQAGAYLVQQWGGFTALSLLFTGLWTLVGLVWLRLGGTPSRWTTQPLLAIWIVFGLQRHIVPRPEVLTLLFWGLMCLAIDHWRRHRGVLQLVAVVVVQWLMVNSHQLYVVGLATQLGFIVHLVVHRALGGRYGLARVDGDLPLGPPVAALAASLGVLVVSPLGWRIYLTPLITVETILFKGNIHRPEVVELQPVWTDPLASLIAMGLLGWVVLQGYRTRGQWRVWEWGLFAMGCAMLATAVRGMPFFAVSGGMLLGRMLMYKPLLGRVSVVRFGAAVGALVLSLGVLGNIATSAPSYYKIQFGVGRTLGEWPDRAMAWLKANPPPGQPINLSWTTGNPMIYQGWPIIRPAVDPRFEAYPADFLVTAQRASDDPEALNQLLALEPVRWVLAEQWLPGPQQRVAELLATGEWSLVFVDEHLVVVVRHHPGTHDYLAGHPFALANLQPPAPTGAVAIDAHAKGRMAILLKLLGDPRAERWIQDARELTHYPELAKLVTRFNEL